MATSEEGHVEEVNCVIHFADESGPTRAFTADSFQTFLSRRTEWLSLSRDYKEFSSVARQSLAKLPAVIKNVEDADGKVYHIECYRLFTNREKIERAKTFNLKHVEDEEEDQPPNKRRRFSVRLEAAAGPSSSSDMQQLAPHRSSANILPRICLVCRKSGPVYVKKVRVNMILISRNSFKLLAMLLLFL